MSLRKRAFTLAWLLAGCGVTAGNPGDHGKTSRFSLYGTVATPEREGYRPERVAVTDGYGAMLSSTTSSEHGFYAFDDLPAGSFVIQVGAAFTQPVQVNADTLFNVVVPLPAPPVNVRYIDLGPADVCLVWDDASALEESFVVEGPPGSVTGPAGSEGLRAYLEPVTAAGLAAQVAAWNDRFAGRYHVRTVNAYGASTSVPVDVPLLDAERWRLVPPEEPPQAGGDAYREKCLSAPRSVDPTFIE